MSYDMLFQRQETDEESISQDEQLDRSDCWASRGSTSRQDEQNHAYLFLETLRLLPVQGT